MYGVQSFADDTVVSASINVADFSFYCIGVCKMKYFTEREFSGIIFGGGILHLGKGNSWWPCSRRYLSLTHWFSVIDDITIIM